MSKMLLRTALAFAIMSTVGLTGAMAAKKYDRDIEKKEIQKQKSATGGLSKDFLCSAEASRQRFTPGSAARRTYIAQCMAR